MNDKFKMLALQAQMGTADFDAGSYYVATPDKMQKFALLIVRECARLAIEKQTENDIAGIVSKNPAKDFAYALVEHFGVEE